MIMRAREVFQHPGLSSSFCWLPEVSLSALGKRSMKSCNNQRLFIGVVLDAGSAHDYNAPQGVAQRKEQVRSHL